MVEQADFGLNFQYFDKWTNLKFLSNCPFVFKIQIRQQNRIFGTKMEVLIPRHLQDIVGWQTSKCIMFRLGLSFAHLLWYIFDKERLVFVCGAAIWCDHVEDYKRDASRQERNTFRMLSDNVIIKINGKETPYALFFTYFFIFTRIFFTEMQLSSNR